MGKSASLRQKAITRIVFRHGLPGLHLAG